MPQRPQLPPHIAAAIAAQIYGAAGNRPAAGNPAFAGQQQATALPMTLAQAYQQQMGR
jgi:hypothetical protein